MVPLICLPQVTIGAEVNMGTFIHNISLFLQKMALFHYYYVKQDKNKELKGSNSYVHFLDEKEKKGMSILELKKYLKSSGVKIRL